MYVRLLAGAALALMLSATPALAMTADQMKAFATVRAFISGLNRGDLRAAAAVCASPSSVLDDFPPHAWQGPTACGDWARGYQQANKDAGVTHPDVTLLTPWHVAITGDRGYVVVPANYRYLANGKPGLEAGSIFTVALKRVGSGWRITAWAWAQH